jgi:hypothetical protein
MNAARLKELCDLIVATESSFNVQSVLQQLVNDVNQITANPGHPQFQTSFSQNLSRLRDVWTQMAATFSPAQVKLLDEIKARQHFVDDVPALIETIIGENSITPAVVRDKVDQIRQSREQYLNTIRELRDRLASIGIEAYSLEPGEAEIGLLIPRDLFKNELGGLVQELRALNRIIRAFSELAVGHTEKIEVKQISTSDPVFILGIGAPTIALLARTVKWALDTWQQVEEIRKIRAETQKLKSFTPEEIEGIFGKKIEQQIEIAVEEKLEQLIETKDKAGRHYEQRNDLKWALESILGRVERGMTVEVRFLPPPNPAEGELAPATATAFADMKQVATQLKFPAPEPLPVLRLPAEPTSATVSS